MRLLLLALFVFPARAALLLRNSDRGRSLSVSERDASVATLSAQRAWLNSVVSLFHRSKLTPLEFAIEDKQHRAAAKGDGFGTVGKSTLAVASLLLQDPTAPWGSENKFPEWANMVLSNTKRHAEKHDHTYMLRRQLTLKNPTHMTNAAPKKVFRVNANWEKFQFVLDYLNTGSFSHILLLDADATFFNSDHDTLRTMANDMDERGVSLLLADEDWWGMTGAENTNGGVQMWKNTTYSKELLQYLIQAHMDPEGSGWDCWGNEQLCLRGFLTDRNGDKAFPLDTGRNHTRNTKVFVASGLRYNRHICALPTVFGGIGGSCKSNPKIPGFRPNITTVPEIMHFMGGGKPNVRNPIFARMSATGY